MRGKPVRYEPLEEESEVNFLHEGAATAVKAAENLTRSLSHNVQWGMDAAMFLSMEATPCGSAV